MKNKPAKSFAAIRHIVHRIAMFTSISCLFAAFCQWQLPVSAQPLPVHRLISSKHPVLKSIAPVEDLSLEAEGAELFDRAVREYAAGRMPQAEKLFEQSLQLDPRNADAHFNLGAIKEWKNDSAAALKHYQAALALKPNDAEVAEAIHAVEYKIKNKPALDAQAAKEKHDEELARHGQLAKQAFASQNYREAAIHLKHLVHARPEDAKIQFALGQCLRALKYYDWSAYRLKMAIYLDPENELYRKTLVELDREMQDAQRQALSESVSLALSKLHQPSFTELSDSGFRVYAF